MRRFLARTRPWHWYGLATLWMVGAGLRVSLDQGGWFGYWLLVCYLWFAAGRFGYLAIKNYLKCRREADTFVVIEIRDLPGTWAELDAHSNEEPRL